MRLTVITANEGISVAVGDHAVDVFLCLLEGDVHVSIEACKDT